MNEVARINNYSVLTLNKELALKYSKDLARLADQIPLVNYTELEILAEAKASRKFYGKWEHSLVVFDAEVLIAILICYERKAENNILYPDNCIYISELAVDKKYQKQGVAKGLLKIFFEKNKTLKYLEGRTCYSVQTNSIDWNDNVIRLYKSFGFVEVGKKEYFNRVDAVLKLTPS